MALSINVRNRPDGDIEADIQPFTVRGSKSVLIIIIV